MAAKHKNVFLNLSLLVDYMFRSITWPWSDFVA